VDKEENDFSFKVFGTLPMKRGRPTWNSRPGGYRGGRDLLGATKKLEGTSVKGEAYD